MITRPHDWASPRSWPTVPGTTRKSFGWPCSSPSSPTATTQARKENGVAVLYRLELAQIKGTLEQCELELQKLHMLAAASDAMLADAWQAFGLPRRSSRDDISSGCSHATADTSTLPFGDGTVGVPDNVDDSPLTCAAEA